MERKFDEQRRSNRIRLLELLAYRSPEPIDIDKMVSDAERLEAWVTGEAVDPFNYGVAVSDAGKIVGFGIIPRVEKP